MNMSNIYVSLPNLFFYFLSPSLFSHFLCGHYCHEKFHEIFFTIYLLFGKLSTRSAYYTTK
jgi:hypothetical protein